MQQICPDLIHHILCFVQHYEVIHNCSLINKSWLEQAQKIPLHMQVTQSFTSDDNKLFNCRYCITSLDLSHVRSGVEQTTHLHFPTCSKGDSKFSNLKKLNLSNWTINDFSNIIESGILQNLTELNLSGASFIGDALYSILDSLNNDLRVLNLEYSKRPDIKQGQCTFILPQALQNLEVLNLSITNVEKLIIPKLVKLKTLSISHNPLLDITPHFDCFPNLTCSEMKSVPVTPDFMRKFLENSPHIQTLILEESIRDPEVIRVISQLATNLNTLDLSLNLIPSTILENLCNSSVCLNIRELRLDQCYSIDMEGCQLIGHGSALRHLTHLSLMYCPFGSEGFRYIVQGPNAANLESLFVEESSLGDEGCSHIAQSKTMTKLTTLNICGNNITDVGCETICQTPNLQHLTTLIIACNDFTQCTYIANNPYFSNLTYLDYCGQIPFTDENSLASSPYLKQINL